VLPVRYELGFYIPEDDILHTYFTDSCGTDDKNIYFVWVGLA
jgi:hypothetical protein